MKASTLNAIKTLLRLDPSVSPDVRQAVIAAAQARPGDGCGVAEIAPDAEVSLAQAAEYLAMSRTTLWRWCERGDVAAIRRGKKFYLIGAQVFALKEGRAA